MNVEKLLILLLIFSFTVFFFGDLETAINAISVSEPLKPLFTTVPYILLASVLLAIVYLGVKD